MAKLTLPAKGQDGSVLPDIRMEQLNDGSLVEDIQIGRVNGGIFTPLDLALDSSLQALLALAQDPEPVQVANAACSTVPAATLSGPLAPANPLRKGLVIINDSTAILYVKFGAGAAPGSFTYFLAGSQAGVLATLELPPVIFTGLVTGIWAAANGSAKVTELT